MAEQKQPVPCTTDRGRPTAVDATTGCWMQQQLGISSTHARFLFYAGAECAISFRSDHDYEGTLHSWLEYTLARRVEQRHTSPDALDPYLALAAEAGELLPHQRTLHQHALWTMQALISQPIAGASNNAHPKSTSARFQMTARDFWFALGYVQLHQFAMQWKREPKMQEEMWKGYTTCRSLLEVLQQFVNSSDARPLNRLECQRTDPLLGCMLAQLCMFARQSIPTYPTEWLHKANGSPYDVAIVLPVVWALTERTFSQQRALHVTSSMQEPAPKQSSEHKESLNGCADNVWLHMELDVACMRWMQHDDHTSDGSDNDDDDDHCNSRDDVKASKQRAEEREQQLLEEENGWDAPSFPLWVGWLARSISTPDRWMRQMMLWCHDEAQHGLYDCFSERERTSAVVRVNHENGTQVWVGPLCADHDDQLSPYDHTQCEYDFARLRQWYATMMLAFPLSTWTSKDCEPTTQSLWSRTCVPWIRQTMNAITRMPGGEEYDAEEPVRLTRSIGWMRWWLEAMTTVDVPSTQLSNGGAAAVDAVDWQQRLGCPNAAWATLGQSLLQPLYEEMLVPKQVVEQDGSKRKPKRKKEKESKFAKATTHEERLTHAKQAWTQWFSRWSELCHLHASWPGWGAPWIRWMDDVMDVWRAHPEWLAWHEVVGKHDSDEDDDNQHDNRDNSENKSSLADTQLSVGRFAVRATDQHTPMTIMLRWTDEHTWPDEERYGDVPVVLWHDAALLWLLGKLLCLNPAIRASSTATDLYAGLRAIRAWVRQCIRWHMDMSLDPGQCRQLLQLERICTGCDEHSQWFAELFPLRYVQGHSAALGNFPSFRVMGTLWMHQLNRLHQCFPDSMWPAPHLDSSVTRHVLHIARNLVSAALYDTCFRWLRDTGHLDWLVQQYAALDVDPLSMTLLLPAKQYSKHVPHDSSLTMEAVLQTLRPVVWMYTQHTTQDRAEVAVARPRDVAEIVSKYL